MKIITEINGYKIEYNGSNTWFIIDIHDDCYGYYNTERKATNALKRILKSAGLI